MDKLKLAGIAVVIASLVGVVRECKAQIQETYLVGAGATFNKIDGLESDKLTDALGYYIEGTLKQRLTDHFMYSAGLMYMNQHGKIINQAVNINSGNVVFLARLYPYKKDLSIMTGFQMGFILGAKAGNEDIQGYNKGSFFWSSGIAYEIRRFEVIARYNKTLSEKFFDYTVQLGLNYRIKK